MSSRTGDTGDAADATRRTLPALPASVAEARRLLRHHLDAAGHDGLEPFREDAELLVSEVMTNAVVHAATPIDLTVTTRDTRLRVEVGDANPHFPTLRTYAAMSATGRGLRMLEQLAADWGVTTRTGGKTVWFEVGTSRSDGAAREDPSSVRPVESFANPAGGGLTVRLLQVPLLLHAAWQAHAESLLREYLLVRLDTGDAVEALEAHAAANDAMALLREQIPVPDLGTDPDVLMAAATEERVTAELVELEVPASSLPHFELLDRDLDESAALAEEGLLLTAPTQPEVRQLRRWLVREVLEQSERPPAALDRTVDPDPAPTGDRPPVARVTHAAEPLVAVDDEGRIVAVSAPALALLGHRSRADLLGHRVLTIIPSRYHQAHVAGFTLHLTEGRDLLIDSAVVVPVLRGDGSEVALRMTVSAENRPDGDRLFVALFERP